MCAIPLCNYYSLSSPCSLFKIHRPDLGQRSPEVKRHYEFLTKFLLSIRPDKDNVKRLLHKEAAAICEKHFKPEDIICYKKNKKLKTGAIPCRNIPVKLSSDHDLTTNGIQSKKGLPNNYCRTLRNIAVVKLDRLSDNYVKSIERKNDNNSEGTLENDSENYDNKNVDKRTTFEKLLVHYIHQQHKFCVSAYKSLDRVYDIEQSVRAEYCELIKRFIILEDFNSIAQEQGCVEKSLEEHSEKDELYRMKNEISQKECKNSNKEQKVAKADENLLLHANLATTSLPVNISLQNIVFQTEGKTKVPRSRPIASSSLIKTIPRIEPTIKTNNALDSSNLESVSYSSTNQLMNLPKTPQFPGGVLIPVPVEPVVNTATCSTDGSDIFEICESRIGRKQVIVKKAKKVHKSLGLEAQLKLFADKARFSACKTVDGDRGTVYKCEICGRMFKKWFRLRFHFRNHTGELNKKCAICNKIYLAHYMQTHMLTHTRERKFKCEKCGKGFIRKHHLDAHLTSITSCILPAFQCNICKQEFVEFEKIKEHFATLHCDGNTHCNSCGTTFSHFCIDDKHQLKLLKPYSCPKCDAKYTFKKTLQTHLFNVHNMRPKSSKNTEKKYKCEQCPKSFRLNINLKKHKSVHIQHICETCGIICANSKALSKHKCKMHSYKKVVVEHICDICEKSFPGRQDLLKHKRLIHSEQLLYCEYCLKSFSDKKSLTSHACPTIKESAQGEEEVITMEIQQ